MARNQEWDALGNLIKDVLVPDPEPSQEEQVKALLKWRKGDPAPLDAIITKLTDAGKL